mmetsp:Transcript_28412/g.79961  ORF Transcript_28412/g.79961 Transcript_28412/m.79961 type:complete len:90 (+) Transcript_28412:1593-1862(+)
MLTTTTTITTIDGKYLHTSMAVNSIILHLTSYHIIINNNKNPFLIGKIIIIFIANACTNKYEYTHTHIQPSANSSTRQKHQEAGLHKFS